MVIKRTYLIALFAVVILATCSTKSKKTTNEGEETSALSDSTKQEEPSYFHKTLTLQNISFDINASGEGSLSQLTIRTSGLEEEQPDIVLQTEPVVNAEIGDLNSDGFPEVLIYTTSAGSGSYGNVIGYSANKGKSVSQINFPDITENAEASDGYMGHDEFALVGTALVRKFPIYKKEDSNSNPTGGTRQVEYKLKDGEASRLFVIDKISKK